MPSPFLNSMREAKAHSPSLRLHHLESACQFRKIPHLSGWIVKEGCVSGSGQVFAGSCSCRVGKKARRLIEKQVALGLGKWEREKNRAVFRERSPPRRSAKKEESLEEDNEVEGPGDGKFDSL